MALGGRTAMVKSMTGFGRYEAARGQRKITVEMKSVNHRYLDLNVKLPKKLSNFESCIRSILKEYIQRGKVDIFVTYEDDSESNVSLKYNETLASEYCRHMRHMAESFGIPDDVCVSTLAKLPDVFVMEEQEMDEEELAVILEEAVRGAADRFVESRVKEGENLKQDLLQKTGQMSQSIGLIEERSPKVIAEYKQRLMEKVRELLSDSQIDESRIVTEAALFADKICVDEETVRLRSHLDSVRRELEQGGAVGRKLDFIAQEMNREANTILSKSNDLSVSEEGIELKTAIEKLREQIQNIE